jgi:hypothetical protein
VNLKFYETKAGNQIFITSPDGFIFILAKGGRVFAAEISRRGASCNHFHQPTIKTIAI